MNELAVMNAPRSTADIVEQVTLIHEVMNKVMQKGQHYGTIPGCGPKPTLLKPGAQKLCLTFRLVPKYEVTVVDMEKGQREYRVKCILIHQPTGMFAGEGEGSCSTMESRYKNRPPAEVYNTCLKIACKRAHVDATISATAASDIFTQDIEDMTETAQKPEEKHEPQFPKKTTQLIKGELVRAQEPKDEGGYFNGEVKGIRFGTKDRELGTRIMFYAGAQVAAVVEEKTAKNGKTWFSLISVEPDDEDAPSLGVADNIEYAD